MYTGDTMACFQSAGMVPVWSDSLKIMVRHGAIEFANCLSILGEMLSGPEALCGLRLCRSFSTPSVVIGILVLEDIAFAGGYTFL